jgi:predicted RNA binding protein YcfA (HicA-like mRNA interferase family)
MFKANKLRSAFENKLGFSKPTTKKHEKYQLQDRDGNFVIHTIISKGASGKDIPIGLFNKIAKQVQLNTNQLEDAANCPLSREDYYNILRNKGFNI